MKAHRERLARRFGHELRCVVERRHGGRGVRVRHPLTSNGIARLSRSMFATWLATSKPSHRPAYVAAMEIDKPMNSIDSSTTTQPTEDTAVEAELTELLGDPHALTVPDAAAPDDRKVRDGVPMLTSIAGGAP
jgi:hypothetical protein